MTYMKKSIPPERYRFLPFFRKEKKKKQHLTWQKIESPGDLLNYGGQQQEKSWTHYLF
jgi:hypothetical protein